MSSNLQIISDLRLTMETGQDLELMATYKGVPVISKAKITRIESAQITMVTHDPGLVCLIGKSRTSILGSDYFEPSTAKVAGVALEKGEIRLYDFSYLGNRLGERMIVRVEPNRPISICLNSGDLQIEGELVDISLQGAGIIVPIEHYAPALKPGAQVQAKFTLPNSPIKIQSTVLSGAKAEDQYRLSIRFMENGEKKTRIFHYLVDRRNEIEKELIAEYQHTLDEIRGEQ